MLQKAKPYICNGPQWVLLVVRLATLWRWIRFFRKYISDRHM